MPTYTYKNASAAPSSTSEGTLYTCPASTAAIARVRAANVDSSNASTLTLTRRDSSAATDYKIWNSILMPINDWVEVEEIVLETGDSLKYTAGHANRIHLTADILEIT